MAINKVLLKKQKNISKPHKLGGDVKMKSRDSKVKLDTIKKWNVNISPMKWIKFTTSCTSKEGLLKLKDDIERLLLKYTKVHHSLQIKNFLTRNNESEFSAQLREEQTIILLKNQNYINTCGQKLFMKSSNDVLIPHEIPQDWIVKISNVLSASYKINPLNNESELDLSNFSGKSEFSQSNIVINLYHPKVMKTLKETTLTELTKLNVSNNRLSNLWFLKDFLSIVKVKSLNISNNNIDIFDGIKCLANNQHVIDLHVTGNKVTTKTNQNFFERKMKNIFPALEFLNGQKLSITALDDESHCLPQSVWNTDAALQQYAINLCLRMDGADRNSLRDLYLPDAVLTIATADKGHSRYKDLSCNYKLLHNKATRLARIKLGRDQIVETLKSFPEIVHLKSSIKVDVLCNADQFKILIIRGIFVERKRLNCATPFNRTVTVTSDGIVQDFMSLRPTKNIDWSRYKTEMDVLRNEYQFTVDYPQLRNMSSDDIQKLRKFSEDSNKDVASCIAYLSGCSSYEDAYAKLKNEMGNR